LYFWTKISSKKVFRQAKITFPYSAKTPRTAPDQQFITIEIR